MFLKDNKGNILEDNLYDGRNSEWFNNLQGHGGNDDYDYLPKVWGKCVPDAVKFDEEALSKDYYYGFNYVNAWDFIEWFEKYRPDLDAGWVTTYEKWRIEKKHYIPDEVYHYLPNDANKNDYHFIEFQNKFDCSLYLYNYLIDNYKTIYYFKDLWICYYFDC